MAQHSATSLELKNWLNHEVYPKLSHDLVFGGLPNFTKAAYSETRYADCPRCHREKALYMPISRPIGNCDHCFITITWWSHIRYDHTEVETIIAIAALAGIEPLTTAPSPENPIFRL